MPNPRLFTAPGYAGPPVTIAHIAGVRITFAIQSVCHFGERSFLRENKAKNVVVASSPIGENGRES
jgi:hypothetical protein